MQSLRIYHPSKIYHVCSRSMGRYVPAVVLVQCFSRDSVKKFTRKDAQKSPCQVKRLEDISSIISPLRDKFAFKFVQEFKVKLQVNILSIYCGTMKIYEQKKINVEACEQRIRDGPNPLKTALLHQQQLSWPEHPFQWHSWHITKLICMKNYHQKLQFRSY